MRKSTQVVEQHVVFLKALPGNDQVGGRELGFDLTDLQPQSRQRIESLVAVRRRFHRRSHR
jgi:hypothetical protein